MKEILLNTIHKTSPNYKKFSALVDDEDFDRISAHNWSVKADRGDTLYAHTKIRGKMITLHRFVVEATMEDNYVDHKDGNGLNCQKGNLRKCTNSENLMNRKVSEKIRARKDASIFKGVHRNNKKWRATLRISYKSIHIGYFKCEIEAAKAYNEAAKKYFGEFARLNVIP